MSIQEPEAKQESKSEPEVYEDTPEAHTKRREAAAAKAAQSDTEKK